MASREETLKKLAARNGRLRVVVDSLLRTEDGREFFMHLHSICGFAKSDTVVNPVTHEIATASTAYNNARRDIYVEIRKLATRVLLTPVEEAAELREQPAVEEDKPKEESK